MPPEAAPAWTREVAWALYRLPFNDLLFKAQSVHRQHFDPNRIQLSKLLNIKTGGCPEDCGYCSQSSHHSTGLAASRLMDVEKVVTEARKARDSGATRYCMGAAWRAGSNRADRVCPDRCAGAHHDAEIICPAIGRPLGHDR